MKKTILLVMAVLSLLAGNLFGQGTINFANNGSTLIVTNGFPIGQGPGPVAVTSSSGLKVQLVYQAAPVGSLAPTPVDMYTGNLGNWTPISTLANISPIAGRFNGGQVITGNDIAPAGNVWLQVLAWSNPSATSLASAIQAGVGFNGALLHIGSSIVWKQGTGDGGPVGAPNIALSGFMGFMLDVPEPSPLVLGGIGGTVIMLFRTAIKRKTK